MRAESIRKQCLLICYYFPPAPMAYAQRVAKLCKYLPQETAWIPHVICGELPWDLLAGRDDTLLKEIPEEVSITRVGSFLSSPLARRLRAWRLYKPVGLLRKLIVAPDNFGDWVKPVVAESEARFREGKGIEAIFASGPPNSVYVAAMCLSKRWKCPLIIDMRDPWESSWGKRKWFESLCYRKTRKIEQEVYQQASVIITNTAGNLAQLINQFPDFADKILMVPNGFDPEDIIQDQGPKLRRKDEHEGTVHLLYLGGFRGKGFEDHFFNAVAAYLQEHPKDRYRLKVHCVGWTANQLESTAKKFSLSEVCHAYGVVPAGEVGRPLSEADIYVLLAPINSPGWIPAKLYYYLAGGKYIFAMIPDGSARDIIATIGNRAEICAPNDMGKARDALARIIQKVRKSEESQRSTEFPAYALPYDRRVIAREIGAILDRVDR